MNSRVMFSETGETISEVAGYYPFGMTFDHPNVPGDHKYLYQGKEFENALGLDTYDFHARMYDPAIGRTFQLDPAAGLFYSLSPYSWVANNPLKFIDPTGMVIEYSDEMTRKERREARQALKKHESSDTYKNLYKQLKSSENRYVIKSGYDENTTAGASFTGNHTTNIEGLDGDVLKIGTLEGFANDEKGGVISFNLSMVDGLSNKERVSVLGDFAVEEVVHAAQYDDLSKSSESSLGLPGTANTEFEAKAIVGQIKLESKKGLWTSGSDRIANDFGVNAFRTKSSSGYQSTLQNWHSSLPKGSLYKKRWITNAQPTLLNRLIR